MTVYVVAQLTFTDRNAYDRYQAQFLSVLKGSGGRLLSADEHPRIIEGTWPHDKLVLLSFPDHARFQSWFDSEQYQLIAADRRMGTRGPLLVVRGV